MSALRNTYSRVISNIKAFVSKLYQDKVQKYLLLSFAVLTGGILAFRDISNIYIDKYYLVAFVGAFLIFLRKDQMLIALAFFIPLLSGLPWNYTLLFFSVFFVIKSKFKLNIIQIILPAFILILEILLYFFYDVQNIEYILSDNQIHTQVLADDIKEIVFYTISIFAFVFICIDKNIKFDIRKIFIYFATAILLQCLIAITVDLIATYNAYIYAKYPDADFAEYFFKPERRYVDILHTIRSINLLVKPGHEYVVQNELMTNVNANVFGYFCLIAIAYFSSSYKKERRVIIINTIILIGLTSLGFFCRSRSFILFLGVLIVLLFAIHILRSNMKTRTILVILVAVGVVLLLLIAAIAAIPQLFDFIFGRFFEENSSGEFDGGRWRLFVTYLRLFFSNINVFLFGTGASRMQLIGIKIFGEPWGIDPITGEYGTGPSSTIHFGLLQLIIGYGALGTIIIGTLLYYIVKSRIIHSSKKDLLHYVPFIMAMLFTTTIQLFTPATSILTLGLTIICLNQGEKLEVHSENDVFLNDIFTLVKEIKNRIKYPSATNYFYQKMTTRILVSHDIFIFDKKEFKENLRNEEKLFQAQLAATTILKEQKNIKLRMHLQVLLRRLEYHYNRRHIILYLIYEKRYLALTAKSGIYIPINYLHKGDIINGSYHYEWEPNHS
ncbi:MAG: hypothetical protein LBR37_04385 [Erysipelotrichaceae bacterium]|jgi:hypothetical protein|nr:hypothetical protein [Erysipelotrichaceae bacterium]